LRCGEERVSLVERANSGGRKKRDKEGAELGQGERG